MIRQEFAKEPKRKFAMSMGSPMDVGYTGERSVDSSEEAEKIEGLPMKGLSHIPILACDYAVAVHDGHDARALGAKPPKLAAK